MSTTVATPAPAAGAKNAAAPAKGKKARPGNSITRLRARTAAASREAKQRASAVLEVLAGARTPTAAARALGVSANGYYVLEERVLAAVVQACEPPPRGRVRSQESQRARLERECARWQRECARQQALVRAAQRTIGLAPPPAPAAKGAGRKRNRRPVARALAVVADWGAAEAPAGGSRASTTVPPPG